MKVVVLGCGPAGLLAAHAASLADHEVVVVSKKRKSQLFGCQYLHAPIPWVMEEDPVTVDYRMIGSAQDYRQKVYGPSYRGTASVDLYATTGDEYGGHGQHAAWDLRKAYDRLWATWGNEVYDLNLTPAAIHEMQRGWEPDLVLSTIPAPLLCDSAHQFHSETVWARGSRDGEALSLPMNLSDNEIVCNGERDVSWYRAAKVYGYSTIEYPGDRKPPFEGIAAVQKPLKTNCTCAEDMPVKTISLGRYGKWKKGVLTHEAFGEAWDYFNEDSQGVLF